MIKRLIRQRRRILFTMIAVMLGTGLLTGAGAVPLLGGAVAGVGAALVIIFARPVRRWVECAGLGCVGMALIPAPVPLLPPLLVIFTLAAFRLLYGRWADQMGLRLALDSFRQSQVDLPDTAVWKALVPGEGHPDDFWSGGLIDFDRDEDDPDTVYLRFAGANGLHDDATLTFLERTAPTSCRYYLEQSEPGGQDDRMVTIDLTEIGVDTTHIDSRMQQDDLPPRLAIARWFDDIFGDELDSFAAKISARRDWSLRIAKQGKTNTDRKTAKADAAA